jgi:hypothetical protein
MLHQGKPASSEIFSLHQKGKPRNSATKTQRMAAHGHLNSMPSNLQGGAIT